MNMPILRVMLSFSRQRVSHSMFVPLTTAQPALRGGRKWNEELTDGARYCTSTTGQSPGNPCADSQDVALIHRPRPRRWGPGKGEQREHGLGRSPADEGVGGAGGLGGIHSPLPLEQHGHEENPQTASPANGMSNAWPSDRPTAHTHTSGHSIHTYGYTHASTFTQECKKTTLNEMQSKAVTYKMPWDKHAVLRNYKNTDIMTHSRHKHSKVAFFLKPDFLVTFTL